MIDLGSPRETLDLGRRLGEACEPGHVIALIGDLGAGKTWFTKGLALGLGIADTAVTSPTFVLMNLLQGRLPLAHFDLYRLDRVDLAQLGFHDFRDDGVTVVEWADKVDEKDLGDHLRITFEVTGPETRRLMFQARGNRGDLLKASLNLPT